MIGSTIIDPYTIQRSESDPLRRLVEPFCCEHMEGFGDALGGRLKTERDHANRIRANQLLYLAAATAEQARGAWQGIRGNFAREGANANFTTDFTSFTTTQIHLALDVFPRLLAPNFVSVQPLPKPSGYVFAMKHYDMDGRDLSNVDAFNSSYSDDVGEGNQIKRIKSKLTKSLVEVKYKKLMREDSHEVNVAVASQYNIDIGALNDGVVADELAWEVDREIINALIAFAGEDYYWDPTAGGTYSSMAEGDRQFYDRNFLRIGLATLEVNMQHQIFVSPNFYVCGSDVVKHLRKMPEWTANKTSDQGDQAISTSQILQIGALTFGKVWHDPMMDPKLMLVGHTSPRSPFYAGYIYAPFGLASVITAAFQDPNTLMTRRAQALAYAKVGISSKQYKRLWLKASS